MIALKNFTGDNDFLFEIEIELGDSLPETLFTIIRSTTSTKSLVAKAFEYGNFDYNNGIELTTNLTDNTFTVYSNSNLKPKTYYLITFYLYMSSKTIYARYDISGLKTNPEILKSIYIPNFTKIGSIRGDLSNCPNLEKFETQTRIFNVGSSDRGSFLLSNCPKLKTVVFAYGTTTVLGSDMFSNTDIEVISVPNTVTTIGSGSISNCPNLTEVIIPSDANGDSITIMSGAFSNCPNLTKVTIKKPIESIQPDSFTKCDNITTLTVSNTTGKYKSLNIVGNPGIVDSDGKVLIWGNANTDLSASDYSAVTEIGNNAFAGSSLTSISSSYTTVIDSNAFKGCKLLSNVSFTSITKIGTSAFDGCTNLLTFNFSSSPEIGNGAFNGCTSLISINGPINSLGDKAFYGCESLESVYLGTNISSFGDMPFGNCDKLTAISVYGGGTQTGKYKVAGNCVYNTSDNSIVSGCNSPNFSDSTLANLITQIGQDAFYGFSGITSIDFSNLTKLSIIGNNAFYGCDKLTKATISNGGAITIKDGAFYSCALLSDLTLTSVISIGKNAFKSNTSLKSVTIPSCTAVIDETAFDGCDNLETITVGSGNASYAQSTGSTINSILKTSDKTLTIGGAVQSTIFNSGYTDSSCTSIGTGAYSGRAVNNQATTYIGTGITEIKPNAFSNANILDLRFTSSTSLIKVGANAFNGSKLTGVTFGRLLSSDSGKNIFNGCSSLNKVTFGVTYGSTKYTGFLSEIPEGTFSGCSVLSIGFNTDYTYNDLIYPTAIGKSAFANSGFSIENNEYTVSSRFKTGSPTTLSSKILSSAKSIGTKAFSNCDIKSAFFNPSIESIDPQSFGGCADLGYIGFTGKLTPIYSLTNTTFDGTSSSVIDTETPITSSFDNYTIILDYTPTKVDTSQEYYTIYSEMDVNSPWYGLVIRIDPSYNGSYASTIFQVCVANIISGVRVSFVAGTTYKYAITFNSTDSTFAVYDTNGNMISSAFYNGEETTVREGEPATYTSTKWLSTTSPTPQLGGDQGLTGRYLQGTINKFEIYNYVMTSEEIAEKFSSDTPDQTYYSHVENSGIPSAITTKDEDSHEMIVLGGTNCYINFNTFAGVDDYAFYGRKGFANNIWGSYTWPITIGKYAFSNSGVTGVNYGYSLGSFTGITEIGEGAFSGCADLTDYDGKSVTTTGANAFSGCTSLVGHTYNGDTYLEVSGYIGKNAFSGCTSITRVKAIDCTYIGDGAFSGCTNLTTVEITATDDATVGGGIFSGCTNLTSLNENVSGQTSGTFIHNNVLVAAVNTITEIPYGVTIIGESVFENRTDLSTIDIPSTISEIRKNAFKGCTGLTKLDIPYSVTKLGNSAFEGCTGLIRTNLPKSLNSSSLGSKVFSGCTSLKVVDIQSEWYTPDCSYPYYVGGYGTASLFEGCTGLEDIYMPPYTYVVANMFKDCTSLREITLASNTNASGDNCFYGCTSLEILRFGYLGKAWGTNALYGCTHLREIYWTYAGGCTPTLEGMNIGTAYEDKSVMKLHVRSTVSKTLAFITSAKKVGFTVLYDL